MIYYNSKVGSNINIKWVRKVLIPLLFLSACLTSNHAWGYPNAEKYELAVKLIMKGNFSWADIGGPGLTLLNAPGGPCASGDDRNLRVFCCPCALALDMALTVIMPPVYGGIKLKRYIQSKPYRKMAKIHRYLEGLDSKNKGKTLFDKFYTKFRKKLNKAGYNISAQNFKLLLTKKYPQKLPTRSYITKYVLSNLEHFNRYFTKKIYSEISVQNLNAEDLCPICLNNFKENKIDKIVKLYKCSHVFDEKCIQEWLNKKDTCPKCRCKVK